MKLSLSCALFLEPLLCKEREFKQCWLKKLTNKGHYSVAMESWTNFPYLKMSDRAFHVGSKPRRQLCPFLILVVALLARVWLWEHHPLLVFAGITGIDACVWPHCWPLFISESMAKNTSGSYPISLHNLISFDMTLCFKVLALTSFITERHSQGEYLFKPPLSNHLWVWTNVSFTWLSGS